MPFSSSLEFANGIANATRQCQKMNSSVCLESLGKISHKGQENAKLTPKNKSNDFGKRKKKMMCYPSSHFEAINSLFALKPATQHFLLQKHTANFACYVFLNFKYFINARVAEVIYISCFRSFSVKVKSRVEKGFFQSISICTKQI